MMTIEITNAAKDSLVGSQRKTRFTQDYIKFVITSRKSHSWKTLLGLDVSSETRSCYRNEVSQPDVAPVSAIIELKLMQDARHNQDGILVRRGRDLEIVASRLNIGRFNHRKFSPRSYHSVYSSIKDIRCSGRRTGRRSKAIVLHIRVFEV